MPICGLALEQSVLRSCKRFSWEISLKRVSISSLWMEREFSYFSSVNTIHSRLGISDKVSLDKGHRNYIWLTFCWVTFRWDSIHWVTFCPCRDEWTETHFSAFKLLKKSLNSECLLCTWLEHRGLGCKCKQSSEMLRWHSKVIIWSHGYTKAISNCI